MEKPEEISIAQEANPSLLTYFLYTCMKLLRDQKALEGLQELIDNCTGKGEHYLNNSYCIRWIKVRKVLVKNEINCPD